MGSRLTLLLHRPGWIAILGSLWFCGCPAVVTPTIASVAEVTDVHTDDPEAEKLFEQGKKAFDAGNNAAAEQILGQFCEQFPNDPLIPAALLMRGRAAFASGDMGLATGFLTRSRQLATDERIADYAAFYLGEVAFNEKRFGEVVDWVAPLAGRFTTRADNERVLLLLWQSSRALGRLSEQLDYSAQLLLLDDAAGQEALAAVHESLQQVTTPDAAVLLASGLSNKDRIWAACIARAALLHVQSGQFNESRSLLVELKEAGVETDGLDARLLQLLDQIGQVDMQTIGCLLPLSGPMRLVGNSALKGVMLGAKRVVFGPARSPLQVVFRDTRGDAHTVAKMVEELVLEENVAAIVGPMDGGAAVAAARQADLMGVPLIVLSPNARPVVDHPFVFRRFSSYPTQIESLAASLSASIARVAVLRPDNGFGKMMANLMTRALSKRSATVAIEVLFSQGTKDFEKVAATLAKSNFDALFLPMTGEQLALAGPALAKAGIWSAPPSRTGRDQRVVPFLVPTTGYSPEVVSRAGRYLQGARFVRETGTRPSWAAFERRYRDEYGQPPNAIGAYGYDTVLMIGQAIKSGVVNRVELQRTILQNSGGNSDVTPFGGFDENGEILASPPIMALEQERLVPWQ